MAATSGLEVNAGEEGDKDRQSLPMSNPLETLQEEIIQKIEQAALKSEAQEPEDQQAQEEQEDMRANDPACLFCDDGGKNKLTILEIELLYGTFQIGGKILSF